MQHPPTTTYPEQIRVFISANRIEDALEEFSRYLEELTKKGYQTERYQNGITLFYHRKNRFDMSDYQGVVGREVLFQGMEDLSEDISVCLAELQEELKKGSLPSLVPRLRAEEPRFPFEMKVEKEIAAFPWKELIQLLSEICKVLERKDVIRVAGLRIGSFYLQVELAFDEVFLLFEKLNAGALRHLAVTCSYSKKELQLQMKKAVQEKMKALDLEDFSSTVEFNARRKQLSSLFAKVADM